MPEILRIRGFRFFLFSHDGREPRHGYVEQAERYAKAVESIGIGVDAHSPLEKAGDGVDQERENDRVEAKREHAVHQG